MNLSTVAPLLVFTGNAGWLWKFYSFRFSTSGTLIRYICLEHLYTLHIHFILVVDDTVWIQWNHSSESCDPGWLLWRQPARTRCSNLDKRLRLFPYSRDSIEWMTQLMALNFPCLTLLESWERDEERFRSLGFVYSLMMFDDAGRVFMVCSAKSMFLVLRYKARL